LKNITREFVDVIINPIATYKPKPITFNMIHRSDRIAIVSQELIYEYF